MHVCISKFVQNFYCFRKSKEKSRYFAGTSFHIPSTFVTNTKNSRIICLEQMKNIFIYIQKLRSLTGLKCIVQIILK